MLAHDLYQLKYLAFSGRRKVDILTLVSSSPRYVATYPSLQPTGYFAYTNGK